MEMFWARGVSKPKRRPGRRELCPGQIEGQAVRADGLQARSNQALRPVPGCYDGLIVRNNRLGSPNTMVETPIPVGETTVGRSRL